MQEKKEKEINKQKNHVNKKYRQKVIFGQMTEE